MKKGHFMIPKSPKNVPSLKDKNKVVIEENSRLKKLDNENYKLLAKYSNLGVEKLVLNGKLKKLETQHLSLLRKYDILKGANEKMVVGGSDSVELTDSSF